MRVHRSLVWGAVLFLAALGAGYSGYYAYQTYLQVNAAVAADKVRALEIETNRTRTIQALESAGVSPLLVSSGFWYTYTDQYGNQSVFYFDPGQWSLLPNLSDAQIAVLVKTVASSTVVGRNAMHEVPESELPANLQFHNTLYNNASAASGTFQNTQTQLEALYGSGSASAEQLWELSYMYELQGDYGKRDELNAMSCKEFKVRCGGEIPVVLSGTVTDLSGRPVQNATVTVLSHPELPAVMTNEKGSYSIKVSALPMEKIRISALKRNFTEGVASTIVIGPGRSFYVLGPIALASPIVIVTIDTQKHTVSDPNDTAHPDGSFVLNATSSSYQIPPGAIVRPDGTPYQGEIDVYIYEFTRDTVPASLVTLDTFDDVKGYAGDAMQSFGMPYIQFFDPSGAELAVMKSKPLLLTYQTPDLARMKSNVDGILPRALTEADLSTLVAASKGDLGFPITATFLAKNEISSFPPFWIFDRKKGVWDNVGIRVLDMSDRIQAPFYTINDQS